MLVLSRKVTESIMVGDLVKITVIEVRGDKVRLGFVAPKEVAVHRLEVYDAIKKMFPKGKNKNNGEGKDAS